LLDAADELLLEARRPADDLRIGSPDLAAAVGGTKTLVNGLTINRDKVFDFIRNWALNTNGFDGISHYWRIVVTVHPDSWTALLDMLGGGQLPGLPTAAAKPAASATGSAGENGGSAVDVPEVVNGVTKPLTGLTDKLTGGTLLQGEKSSTGDGSSTGLNEKQESGLLGFLFGGGE
jgi:phospholipid/cholesterol/gamma-HCH transport system substrate-binding protein